METLLFQTSRLRQGEASTGNTLGFVGQTKGLNTGQKPCDSGSGRYLSLEG